MYYHTIAIAALLALSSRQIGAQEVLATECYCKFNSAVGSCTYNPGPCGVVTPTSNFTVCCAIGDLCLVDGFCHNTQPISTGQSETGYYIGGCTDSSFSSPACHTSCNDQAEPDVVFNSTANDWACCGVTNGLVHCDAPTDEIFSAPNPSVLSVTYLVPATVSTATSSSPSAFTPTSTSSLSSSASPSAIAGATGGGLDTGAKAGVGVSIGCTAAGLSIGLVAWFFARRRRRRTAKGESSDRSPGHKVELSSQQEPQELDSLAVKIENNVRHELG